MLISTDDVKSVSFILEVIKILFIYKHWFNAIKNGSGLFFRRRNQ